MLEQDKESLLDTLAEEFADRVRNGQTVDVDAIAARYPDLAEQIQQLFPMVQLLEAANTSSPSNATTKSLSPSTTRVVKLPDSIGGCRIVREIGRGGMGIVYEAIDPRVPRNVALKILAPWASHDPRHVQRFESEARTIASLRHPHIVPLLTVGQDQHSSYLVMQLIDGCALSQVVCELRQGRRSDAKHGSPITGQARTLREIVRKLTCPQEAASSTSQEAYFGRLATIGAQAASALQHAASQGVVHRDIKPSNLLITDELTVWVTDFGMAKSAETADLTHTGEVVGTLRYLAPERLHGTCDERSDIYGLGASLYEFATLQPPFGDVSDAELVRLLASADPPRPRSINPKIPKDLETVIRKAMAKNPSDRYSTAKQLAADLTAVANGNPIKARLAGKTRLTWRWMQRHPHVAGTIVAAAACLAAAFGIPAITAWNAWEHARTSEAQADHGWAMLAASDKLWQELYDEREVVLLGHTGTIEELDFSPDGKRLATASSDKTIRVWDCLTGEQLKSIQGHTDTVFDVAFSPDGRFLVSAGMDKTIKVWDAKTFRECWTLNGHEGQARCVQFSPDSRSVFSGSADGTIRVWDLMGKSPGRILRAQAALSLVWR